jgi:hypothetical protein
MRIWSRISASSPLVAVARRDEQAQQVVPSAAGGAAFRNQLVAHPVDGMPGAQGATVRWGRPAVRNAERGERPAPGVFPEDGKRVADHGERALQVRAK